MPRTEFLFATAALLLIVVGLVAGIFAGYTPVSSFVLSITSKSRGTTYAVPTYTVTFGLAALFCIFATVYSIFYLPISKTVGQWHVWLSIAGLLVLIFGFYGLTTTGGHQRTPPAQEWPQALVISSVVGGFVIFAAAQVCFVTGFVRALLQMCQA